MKNTLVIGDVNTGKTSYLQNLLEGIEGVFWIALGSPVPEGAVGASVWSFKQWLDVTRTHKAELEKASVVVMDGFSNLYGLLITEIVMVGNKDGTGVGRNPEQKDYSAAAYRLYQGFLMVGALGKTMHASVLTREKEEGTKDNKVKTTEIFLSPMVSGYVLPSFPNAAYLTMKVLAGETRYAVQENSALAKQLIPAKVK